MSLDHIVRRRLEKNPIFVRECCKDTHNLRYPLDMNNRKDTLVLKCKHCGAVHHRQYITG